MSRPDEVIAGRYRLVDRIATGGMGSVWEAWDEVLHRRVALKELHLQPGLSPHDAELAANRAMREARITARLHHPHAVPVYDVADHDGLPCLIMQYLPSRSLQSLLKQRGTLPVEDVARYGSEVAGALAAAHQAGIVHRDVKPGNILIDEDGSAKLTDFGISHAHGDAALTSTGMVTGTPAFLAPEVARGAATNAASDVFSLGATLYTATEGMPPFGSEENPMAMLHRVAAGNPVPPRRSGRLTGVLERMLALDPRARPSMSDATRLLRDVATAGAARTTAHMPSITPTGPPPPTQTVTLPAQGAERPPPVVVPPRTLAPARTAAPPREANDPRRRSTVIAVAAVIIVLGLATVLGIQLLTNDSGSGGQAGGSGSRRQAPNTPQALSTRQAAASAASSPTSSAPGTSEASSPAGESSSQISSSTASGAATTQQLRQAVTDYYALLPGGTATAFQRLTPSYQSGHAGGRSGYEQFWNGFSSVSVSGVTVNLPDTVTATINYERKDGTRTSERTSFGLVRQEGILKIDSSSVTS